jgi:hypothetical protein
MKKVPSSQFANDARTMWEKEVDMTAAKLAEEQRKLQEQRDTLIKEQEELRRQLQVRRSLFSDHAALTQCCLLFSFIREPEL